MHWGQTLLFQIRNKLVYTVKRFGGGLALRSKTQCIVIVHAISHMACLQLCNYSSDAVSSNMYVTIKRKQTYCKGLYPSTYPNLCLDNI